MNVRSKIGRKIIASGAFLVIFSLIFTEIFFNVKVMAGETGGTAVSEDIEKFPASYRKALYELKAKHPNWTFQVFNTGLDWKNVLKEEMTPEYRSLVPSYFPDTYTKGYYGDGWSCASALAVEYYMDPRNWLTEDYIFQFELLSYNGSAQGIATVQKVVENTFMRGFIEGYENMGLTYAQAFCNIGELFGVNPVHLATRVYQEQGAKGDSDLISGKYPGYENYYNYYNIQASGSTHEEIVRNGLNEAKSEGWNNRYAALYGGSKKVADMYIKRGQDTLYLQKFDVDYSDGTLYWHQYMQNLCAPSNEGKKIKTSYEKAGMLNSAFVFKIPVYENMPDEETESATYDGVDYSAVYNKEYYMENNADLKKALGDDAERLIKHFVEYGMAEGRPSSPDFILGAYKYYNRDLVSLYGNDNKKYYMHYIKWGKEEGRQATGQYTELEEPTKEKEPVIYEGVDYASVYDESYYKKNNGDLVAAYGNDSEAYIRHFVKYGMAEGRPSSPDFDLKAYKYYNKDLVAAFGNNNIEYYMHYINWGEGEGRRASAKGEDMNSEPDDNNKPGNTTEPDDNKPGITIYEGGDFSAVYNESYYKKYNGDLVAAFGDDSEAYIRHFVEYGMSEGRPSSPEFNLKAYKYYNRDLVKAYGSSNIEYYMHYIKYGKAEGRDAVSSKPDSELEINDGTDDNTEPKPTEPETPPASDDKPEQSHTIYQDTDFGAVYDENYYKANNADLVAAYGDDWEAYIRHFVEYGMSEGRPSSPDFNLDVYKEQNPDLAAAYGENNLDYYLHYIKWGKAEGRRAK